MNPGALRFDLARARAETPGCADVVHLNNAGSSLPPQPVLDAVIDHLRLEARAGGYEAYERAAEGIARAGNAIARLIGATVDTVAACDSATRGWHQVVGALPFQPGDRVLTHRAEYASSYLMMLRLAREQDVSVEVVPSTETGEIAVDALRGMLDERVKLVALTHMPTSSGLVNPAGEVGAALAGRGIPYLLDACQTVGQLPIDVRAIGCDFLVTSGRKFLRAPRGTGFMYVAPAWLEQLEPEVIDLHAAEWTTIDGYALQPDARRFEPFERSWAGYLGLGAAAEYAQGFGLEAIWARVHALADRLRTLLRARPGVTVHDEGAVQGGIVTFTIDGHEPEAVRAAAHERGINVWVTPASVARLDLDPRDLAAVIRASVHYYNTDEELDRLLDALPAARPG